MQSSPAPSEESASYRLVRHRKCDDWGRGLLLWERDGKRSYQFEDGQVRVFAEGFFHLLDPLDDDDEGLSEALAGLASRSGSGRGAMPVSMSFEEQVGNFMDEYPGGFEGDIWQTRHRGRGERRPLKRHREPLIESAKANLKLQDLQGLAASERYGELRDRIGSVLRSSDLVPKGKLDDFHRMAADRRVATALIDVVEHEQMQAERFDELRASFGAAGCKDPGWALLSSLLAIAHPKAHTFVRAAVFEVQAPIVSLTVPMGARPSAVTYPRFLEVARSVFGRLKAEGREPADLFDVYDFMTFTLRPVERTKTSEPAKKRKRPAAAAAPKPAKPRGRARETEEAPVERDFEEDREVYADE